MKKPENKGLEALRTAKALLDNYLRDRGSEETIASARHHLARAEAEMMRLLKVRPVRTRQGANIAYLLETISGQPLLTEQRRGATSKPYRTTKEVYDAVAHVLQGSTSPPDSEEIVAELSKKLRGEVPLHEVRMVLRYWQHTRPQILKRAKRKYHRISDDFFDASQALWAQLQAE